ncbi:MAG TPA: lycopene cyclase domain-containing protein [Candidatus Paceibacterota bacterium]
MYYPIFLLVMLVTALIIEKVFHEHLFHSFKERSLCIIIAVVAIMVWDFYGIPREHWIFTGKGISGIFIGPMPIEEIGWTLFVPYLWVTIYIAIHSIFDKKRNKNKWKS